MPLNLSKKVTDSVMLSVFHIHGHVLSGVSGIMTYDWSVHYSPDWATHGQIDASQSTGSLTW